MPRLIFPRLPLFHHILQAQPGDSGKLGGETGKCRAFRNMRRTIDLWGGGESIRKEDMEGSRVRVIFEGPGAGERSGEGVVPLGQTQHLARGFDPRSAKEDSQRQEYPCL